MKTILVLATMLSFSWAHADQCQWNSKADARSALSLLEKGREILFWCQNCNEVKPSPITVVDDVKMDREHNEISIKAHQKNSGKSLFKGDFYSIDLAYTYIRTASDTFANLAHLVGCPSVGATTFIQTTPKGEKIPHFYNFKGERETGAPLPVELASNQYESVLTKGQFRAPASNKESH